VFYRNNLDFSELSLSQPDECRSPLRILVPSYGFAAIIAILAAFAGAGIWASALLFWLGGAAIVLALALILTGRKTEPSEGRQRPFAAYFARKSIP